MSNPSRSMPTRRLDPPTVPVLRALDGGADTARVPSVRHEPGPGDIIAERYELCDRVAAGGLGVVFRAIHRETGRVVAVKLLHERYREDASLIERSAREARFACSIRHPNIVEILDAGRSADGHAFITMEFLDGRTLRTLLRDAKCIAPDDAVGIIMPIIDAVAAAHAVGVVHRDLKPENVIVVEDNGTRSIKVLDFGIAGNVAAPGSDHRLTSVGTVLGTHPYMSPEQATGAIPEPSFDVFSLGVMLHEMLTGVLPFGSDPSRSLVAKVRGVVDPKAYDHAGVPAAWRALVARCVAVDPSQRPTAAQLGVAVSALRGAAKTSSARRRALRPIVLGVGVVLTSLVAGTWFALSSDVAAPAVAASIVLPEPPNELAASVIVDPVETAAVIVPQMPATTPTPSLRSTSAERPPQTRRKTATVACDDVRTSLRDAREAHRWHDVLAAADVRQCWTTELRVQWRTKALMELGRFAACAKEGRNARSERARDWANLCTRRLALAADATK